MRSRAVNAYNGIAAPAYMPIFLVAVNTAAAYAQSERGKNFIAQAISDVDADACAFSEDGCRLRSPNFGVLTHCFMQDRSHIVFERQ